MITNRPDRQPPRPFTPCQIAQDETGLFRSLKYRRQGTSRGGGVIEGEAVKVDIHVNFSKLKN